MIVIHDLGDWAGGIGSLVTIGAFDGVHLGHQALIRQLVGQARSLGCQAALVTFHPHPAEVLNDRRDPLYLTTPEEKVPLVESLGVDVMAVLPFTRQLADTSAAHFLGRIGDALHLRELWVGPNFALGRSREGDIPALRALARAMEFELRVVAPLTEGGEAITSSRIRQLVLAGRVRDAGRLLGRRYSVTGQVEHGDHRGRTLGFPTANLAVPPERIMPPNGVYAAYARANGQCHGAVMSWGVRPTFGHNERLLEIHLLDFDGDLYGADLTAEFVEWLRPELTFDGPQALIAQMHEDSARAQRILDSEDKAR
jgi:riboflavin kinase/FMN adenylyltransferase